MASSEDAAALAGEESAPPEQTITVKMMRTPLGLGLTVDSQNKVVKIAADSQAQKSGGFTVGHRLISLNGQALSAGVSFDKQLSTIAVGTPVIIEVSMPAEESEVSMPAGKSGSKKKNMASSKDVAALAGDESAPPEQTITVKMMRTPLGLGLTVDSQNKVV